MTDIVYGFTYFQTTASTTWNIHHALNLTCPVIQVYINYEGGVQRVLPLSVSVVDANNLTVTFTDPQSGYAKLK
jgi:hypothetical protein